MKNKIGDLNNHLFAQLERLGDESLTPEQLDAECRRAEAIAEISEQLPRGALPLLNGGRASILHYDEAPSELKPSLIAVAKLKAATAKARKGPRA